MSPENSPARARMKEDNFASAGRKSAQSKAPVDQALKCPRCDSPNTKFCYYNNYSLTQPRHFCKTCRRYWTKGGALRNVPIGGGCRKNKKVKSSLRLSGSLDSKDSGSSNSEIGGLRFFNGLSPAMDFQVAGNLPFSRVHHAPTMGMYDQFGVFSLEQPRNLTPFTNLQSPLPAAGFNGLSVDTTLASSIESLSSINQDLHWKLQQQRLSMLFGGENDAVHKDRGVSSAAAPEEDHRRKLQPILFQNLEISKPEVCDSSDMNTRKERVGGADSALNDQWFFGNAYTATTTAAAPISGAAAASYNSGGSGGFDEVHEWNDLQQYSELP